MATSGAPDDEWANSMCAVYAKLVQDQIESDDTDMETVSELLGHIQKYCSTMPFPAGETPAHLEEYQYESDGDG